MDWGVSNLLQAVTCGAETCLTPLTLKLVMTMDMNTEHLSVGMLSPFKPIGMCIEQ